MTAFQSYARYYDLLYGTKDYERECDFLEEVFTRFSKRPVHSILDVGCGTGGHLIPLAGRGYEVAGLDLSASMLEIAETKLREAGVSAALQQTDARSFDLKRTYDAVVSMFAAFGYITDNQGIASALSSVRRHLRPGGVFVMDFWYGPAVLQVRPETRVLRREDEGVLVLRTAVPQLNVAAHTNVTHYELLALRDSTLLDHIEEDHAMRFFFPQEICHYLEEAGLEFIALNPFLNLDQEMADDEWNAVVIGRAPEQ
jgi:SAM-dependent methyltransferase